MIVKETLKEAEREAIELSDKDRYNFYYVFMSTSAFNKFRVDFLGILFSDEIKIATFYQTERQQ